MNKFLKISVIMLFVIALLITGGILMSKDKNRYTNKLPNICLIRVRYLNWSTVLKNMEKSLY